MSTRTALWNRPAFCSAHSFLAVHPAQSNSLSEFDRLDFELELKVEAIEEDGESSQEELEQLAMASC